MERIRARRTIETVRFESPPVMTNLRRFLCLHANDQAQTGEKRVMLLNFDDHGKFYATPTTHEPDSTSALILPCLGAEGVVAALTGDVMLH